MYNIVAFQQDRIKILQNKDGNFKFKCGYIILYLTKDEMKEIRDFIKLREFDCQMNVKGKSTDALLDIVNDRGELTITAAYDELEYETIELSKNQSKSFVDFLLSI